MNTPIALAAFLKNRIKDLNEGLGDGTTMNPFKIAGALIGMGQTLNALEDIVPIIEEMGSLTQPRTMPFPNMEKPSAELPSDAVVQEIFCNKKGE